MVLSQARVRSKLGHPPNVSFIDHDFTEGVECSRLGLAEPSVTAASS